MKGANKIKVLLADDDKDDCLLFKEALEELPLSTVLSIVHDGEQLMKLLKDNPNKLPHVLFLDLNMPRKNGFECLAEIRDSRNMKGLIVIISSTTSKQDMVDLVYKYGAHHYIRKPSEFPHLKNVIHQVLINISEGLFPKSVTNPGGLDVRGRAGKEDGLYEQPPIEKFVLSVDSEII